MNTNTVKQFVQTVKQKMVEQNLQLAMVRSMQESALLTSKTFKKLHRNITRESTFYQYYEAKLALDTKDARDLREFRAQLQAHLTKTEKMLKSYEKPYKKLYSAYYKAEKAHMKRISAYDAFTKKLQQKENLNYIAPEARLAEQISVMRERQARLNQDVLLAKAAHTNQQGGLYKLTNDFVAQLQSAYYNIIKFEKLFFEHVSNIEDVTIFFNKIREINEQARKIDVLQTSSKYFNETLKLQEILKEAVFDTETEQLVRQYQKLQADARKQQQIALAAEKERYKQAEKQAKVYAAEEAKAQVARQEAAQIAPRTPQTDQGEVQDNIVANEIQSSPQQPLSPSIPQAPNSQNSANSLNSPQLDATDRQISLATGEDVLDPFAHPTAPELEYNE